jgi:hypothetical protein
VRTDVAATTPTATLASIYATAGRGLPIPVVQGADLVGQLDPIEVLAELGRVERLAEDLREGSGDGDLTDGDPTDGGSAEQEVAR